MTVCTNCGNKGISYKQLFCKVCGNEGCKECMNYLFSFFQFGIEPQFQENWYCHSKNCYQNFAEKMETFCTKDILNRDKFGIGLLRGVFHNATKNPENNYWLSGKIPSSLSLDDFLFHNANLDLVARIEKFGKQMITSQVE